MRTLTTLSLPRFGAPAVIAFAMLVVFAFGNTAHAGDMSSWDCFVTTGTGPGCGGGDNSRGFFGEMELSMEALTDISFITPAHAGDMFGSGCALSPECQERERNRRSWEQG